MKLHDLAPDILTSDPAVRRLVITGVTADSRSVQPGVLFAALPGTKVRGASFIPQAVANGAAVILTGANEDLPSDVPIPVLRDADPRRRFAKLAARFYAPQPKSVVAVTGTNGKTSVASFVRQIWTSAGHAAASLGTVGVVARTEVRPGNMTTPDPVTLHRTLHGLQAEGIEHVALEASSHGLDQRRLDGLTIRAAAFTNLSRDHLDYHGSMEAYLAAKTRLFDTVLDPGAVAVVNVDDPFHAPFVAAARISGLDLRTVGGEGQALRILDVARDGFDQIVTVDAGKGPRRVKVPLLGTFQVSNALIAADLASAGGDVALDDALDAVAYLKGAPGRLELVARGPYGAPIFVDYAHTPAALEVALSALRPFADGRLIVAFGAGGDRDRGKRPEMGAVVQRLADIAIVTDDNPRSETPGEIRAAVLAAAPSAIEIGDRAEAIRHGLSLLRRGDILLVAGKGHETGQEVAGKVLPFSDHEAVLAALPEDCKADIPLWTHQEVVEALKGSVEGSLPEGFSGVSIDSRTVQSGEIFFAIAGDRFDGHDFVVAALERGAGLAVVSRERRPSLPDGIGPLVVVEDVLEALRCLARAARDRSAARIVAVTGSVGKTSTKEALRRALGEAGAVHASVASFNNHWGVPLTLSRLPRDADYGVFEIGMNHAGEITPLTRLVRPHVAIVTTVAAVHLENFPDEEGIARAKAEILDGLDAGGTAILNGDNRWFDLLASVAEARGVKVVSFGTKPDCDIRMTRSTLKEDCSIVSADFFGETVSYKIGVPGEHLVMNSLAVLGTLHVFGVDLARSLLALQHLEQPKGRGRRHRLLIRQEAAVLIDESYNANPTSMMAAIKLLGQASVGAGGRRIAVLGDMLELGPTEAELHAGLVEPLAAAEVDKVFCSGPRMKALWQVLPRGMRGAYAEASSGLESPLMESIRGGDAVMIKGSLGSRMGPLVDLLIDRFGTRPDSN